MADETFTIMLDEQRIVCRTGSEGASQTAATRAEAARVAAEAAQAGAETARDEGIAAPLEPTITALEQGVNAGAETLEGSLDYVRSSLRLAFADDYYRSGTSVASTLAALGVASVTQAATTYADWTGGMASFAPNTLRETPDGLVIEGARTNSITYSEDASNAAFTKTRVTVTANAGADPLGGTTADKVIPSVDNNTHLLQRFAIGTAATGQICRISRYFKAAGYSQVRMQIGAGGGFYAEFDLSAGTVLAVSSVSGGPVPTATIKHVGNGIYRCTMVATFTSNSNGLSITYNENILSGGSTTFAGDGTSGVLVWGLMYPDGHLSYVPTTSASVTVGADVGTLALMAGAGADTITATRGGVSTVTLRSALADPLVYPIPTGTGPITTIELAPASASAGANVAAIKAAVREYGFYPRPAGALAANDTPTLTMGTAGAVSTINGAAPNLPTVNRTSPMLSYVSGVPKARGASYPLNTYYTSRGAYYGTSDGISTPLRATSYVAYEFTHTGTQFEIPVLGQGAAGVNFRVLVNDCVGATASVPNGTGSLYFVKLVFPASGTRRIRVETAGVPVNGVNVTSTSEIASVARSYPLVTLISDSFWEGTGSEVGDMESVVMARALGFNAALAAVGSTGMINPGGNNTSGYPKVAWTDVNRLTDLTLSGVTSDQTGLSVSPAMGIVGVSLNDSVASGVWSPYGATLTDAIVNRADVLISAWVAAHPGKPLVFLGPLWPSGQPDNRPVLDIYRIRDGVQRACASRSSQNVHFIDRLMPPLREGVYSTVTDQAYLYTGGTTGTDATHPTPAGHRFDGLWMANALRRLILSELA